LASAKGSSGQWSRLTSYSARARASNFDPNPNFIWNSEEEYEPTEDNPASLVYAVKFAHKYNVRVYVAFNTLVFDEELHEVQELIEQIWDCGVDAVIIQDIGVAKIVKEVVARLSKNGRGNGLNGAPLEIHASTQQTVTCADGVSFAAERTNATRVVSKLTPCNVICISS
jgi:collagenase-like PrtC family protease